MRNFFGVQHARQTTSMTRTLLLWSLMLTSPVLLATSKAAGTEARDSVAYLKQLSLEELMELQVTSVSRHPEKLIDAASSIQVITGEEIRRSAASSLPEALRLANNLTIAQKNSREWGITARGFNSALVNKLLVVIDGRTVFSPLFSGVFWDVQDYLLEDVDRIEVVSGPGSTLWGANAVNGVINIVSKNARDTQGLYVEGGGGTELRDFGSMRYGTSIAPNVYLRVYGKFSDRDNGLRADGTDATDAWFMRRGGFRLDTDGGPSTLTLQGDVYDGSEYVATGGVQEVGGGNLLGRWSHVISEESDMALRVYYDRTHLRDPITNVFGARQYLTDDLDTYDVDFQHRFAVGERHRIVWGLGYRFTHDSVGNASNAAFWPARLDHELYSGFVQDEIALRPDVSLILGTKLEHNDYTGAEVEPTIRLQWNRAANQSFWTAISRAVRMPSRVDRDFYQPARLPFVL